MIKKFLLLILAVAAIGIAFFSYTKYYARKDISGMLNNARLNASVKTALALNRHLKNTQIDVAATGGTVTLTGAVGTPIQKQLAEEIALSIRGASTLQNNLTINKVLTVQPPENERTLGEKLDDLTIEACVKAALHLNENIGSRSISIRSHRGAVVLSGSVDSPAEQELALKIADDVEGVVSVENKLLVAGDAGVSAGRTSAEIVDDARIEAQVRAALMVNRNLDSTEIETTSRNGIVTLTGIAHSGAEQDLAQRIAEGCRGVQGVVNQLRITQGPREE